MLNNITNEISTEQAMAIRQRLAQSLNLILEPLPDNPTAICFRRLGILTEQQFTDLKALRQFCMQEGFEFLLLNEDETVGGLI